MDAAVYAGCILALVAGFAAVVPLRRAGDREWARYQRRKSWMRMGAAFSGAAVAMVGLGSVMSQAVRAASEFERTMQGIARTVEKRPPV